MMGTKEVIGEMKLPNYKERLYLIKHSGD
jgi:hypothetical protein